MIAISIGAQAKEVDCRFFGKAQLGAITKDFSYTCSESLTGELPPHCKDASNTFAEVTQIQLQRVGLGIDTGLEIKLLKKKSRFDSEIVFSNTLSSYGGNPRPGETLVCEEVVDSEGSEYKSIQLRQIEGPLENTYEVTKHDEKFTILISQRYHESIIEHKFTFEQ